MTRALTSMGIVGVLICTTVAGCAYMSPLADTAELLPMACPPSGLVQITTIVPYANDPSKRELTLDDEPARVCAMQGFTLHWQITGSAAHKYSFTDHGIEFNGLANGTPPGGGGKQFDWIFPPPSLPPAPPLPPRWKYTINFREQANGVPDPQAQKWTCDPTIVIYAGLNAPGIRTLSNPAKFTCVPLP